jgi:hypothetical protein
MIKRVEKMKTAAGMIDDGGRIAGHPVGRVAISTSGN